jgi:hypothetical protein
MLALRIELTKLKGVDILSKKGSFSGFEQN